jgi:hypothetical protein
LAQKSIEAVQIRTELESELSCGFQPGGAIAPGSSGAMHIKSAYVPKVGVPMFHQWAKSSISLTNLYFE